MAWYMLLQLSVQALPNACSRVTNINDMILHTFLREYHSIESSSIAMRDLFQNDAIFSIPKIKQNFTSVFEFDSMEPVIRFLGLIPTAKESVPDVYASKLSKAYMAYPTILTLGLRSSGKTSFVATLHSYLSSFGRRLNQGIGGVGDNLGGHTTREIVNFVLPDAGDPVVRIIDTPGKAWFSNNDVNGNDNDSKLLKLFLEGVPSSFNIVDDDSDEFRDFEQVQNEWQVVADSKPGFVFLIIDGAQLLSTKGGWIWQTSSPVVPEEIKSFVMNAKKITGSRETFLIVTHRDALGRMKNDVRAELSSSLAFAPNRIFFIHNITSSHFLDSKTRSQVESIIHTLFQTYLTRVALY